MASHSLEDLVKAIQAAVLGATDIAERHELHSLEREEFWYQEHDKNGKPITAEDGTPVYRPRMVTLRMPVPEDGKLVEKDIQVPLQPLVTGQSLAVDEISVEMDVELHGLDGGEESKQLMCSTTAGGNILAKRHNSAKLKITFNGTSPPEGYARIDNQLIKLLP